jgi:hypothetical protein
VGEGGGVDGGGEVTPPALARHPRPQLDAPDELLLEEVAGAVETRRMRAAGVVSLWDSLVIIANPWLLGCAIAAADSAGGGAGRFCVAGVVGLTVVGASLLALWKTSSAFSRASARAEPTRIALFGFYAAPVLLGVAGAIASYVATSRVLMALYP